MCGRLWCAQGRGAIANGFVRAKSLIGTAANETLHGDGTNNTLDGGAGNDTLFGQGGTDTYLFGRGYGQDVIINNGASGFFRPSVTADGTKHDSTQRWAGRRQGRLA